MADINLSREGLNEDDILELQDRQESLGIENLSGLEKVLFLASKKKNDSGPISESERKRILKGHNERKREDLERNLLFFRATEALRNKEEEEERQRNIEKFRKLLEESQEREPQWPIQLP
jgi:hypothetical protein